MNVAALDGDPAASHRSITTDRHPDQLRRATAEPIRRIAMRIGLVAGMLVVSAAVPAANDDFYQVQIASGTGWIDQGYMWLDVGSPTVQTWYGVGLPSDLIGNGGPIRFQSVEPPSAGSKDVYLLE